MINVQDLSGSDRAAIFLMSLEEREATEVLKHMPVAQVQKIGQAMASLSKVSREEALRGVYGPPLTERESRNSAKFQISGPAGEQRGVVKARF